MEIRENGLLYFNDLVRWDQFTACRWDTECQELLIAEIRRGFPLLRPVSAPLILYVPEPQRPAVDSLLTSRALLPAAG